MSSLRAACTSDLPAIVEMGKKFLSQSHYRNHICENADNMATVAEGILSSDRGGIIVSEQDGMLTGMLGFVIYPHFLTGEMTAGEVFWWVEPEHRGDGLRLMRRAESMAQFMGAKKMQMVAPTPQVGNVYQRLGYEFLESAYQRTL